jgi:O-acetyl-ADP-ribose deacetylase (regulator of RNase III)
MAELSVLIGRIETVRADAIVNAANIGLWPGGGVDGAIRAAAGPELTRLLDHAGRLEEGAALATPGFQLPAAWVIHTVAPVWRAPGAERDKVSRLAQCYRSCLETAADLNLRKIVFPALGTGAFGWPKPLACATAVAAVRDAAARFGSVSEVAFCCFEAADAEIYRVELAA